MVTRWDGRNSTDVRYPPFWAICGCLASISHGAPIWRFCALIGPKATPEPGHRDRCKQWLRRLCLPVPDGAVGHDVAVGAPPLDLAAFELLLVQRRVYAALAQQGAVGTGFDHAPGVDDVDDVGVDDGGQAMGHGDGGPCPHRAIEGLLDPPFAGCVEAGGVLVPDQDAGVVQQDPCDG